MPDVWRTSYFGDLRPSSTGPDMGKGQGPLPHTALRTLRLDLN